MCAEEVYQCPYCGWTAEEGLEDISWEHCPNCLSAVHAYDSEENECGGEFEPISIWVKDRGRGEIIHRCVVCGSLHTTPMTGQDNPVKLMSLAAGPLGAPAFPLERMQELLDLMGGQGSMEGWNRES